MFLFNFQFSTHTFETNGMFVLAARSSKFVSESERKIGYRVSKDQRFLKLFLERTRSVTFYG
jgi:hypothetical protein